jgi:hypothetical protein
MREGPSNRLAGAGLKPPSAAALLRSVVVSEEGKGPEEKFGSGDFSRERNESEPLPCRKDLDDVETTVVRRSWDQLRRGLLTDGAASGIRVA